jgi:hypothetical protein
MRKTVTRVWAVPLFLSFVACTQSPAQPPTPITAQPPAPAPGQPPTPVTGGVGSWSNPATWGGRVPDANSAVTIPTGTVVTLDSKVNIRNLTIMGTLVCADRDLELTANWVMVHAPGKLECGTPAKPFTKQLLVTLNSSDQTEDVMGMGTKFFGAMGGTVDLHGEARTSWTKLEGTVQAGATQIKVLEASQWRVGDRIVVAPTDFDPLEAEERAITAINGTTLTLDAPLKYRHWGKVQTLGSTGATMDQRAEVALLSRNITLRGQNAKGSYFGGHLMFMSGATARLSNIEVSGMGQLTRLGRYPIHFHKLGDGGSASYLKNSSVHHNLQRAIVTHQSNNLNISNNVVFDTVGHAVFLESAVEVNNVFDRNLVMLVRMVPKAFRSDEREFELCQCFGSQLQNMHERLTPSGFWISNQHNRFTNNVVAGVQFGYGYWFNEGEMSTIRDVPEFYNNGNIFQGFKPEAYRKPFLEFSGNTAHSINAVNDDGRTTQYASPMAAGLFMEHLAYFPEIPNSTPVFKDFRVWKTAHTGVWAQTFNQQGLPVEDRAPIVDGLVAADTRTALFVEQGAGPTRVRNSVLYGFTDNLTPGQTVPLNQWDWRPYWESISHSLENVDIQPIAISPNSLPYNNDLKGEDMLTYRANDGLNTPVFLEFSNVQTKGWPSR